MLRHEARFKADRQDQFSVLEYAPTRLFRIVGSLGSRSIHNFGAPITLSFGDCIFCQIVAGESPASVIYRDDRVIAFMDIRPVNPGHLLVIPIAHTTYLYHLDEQTEQEHAMQVMPIH